TICWFSPISGIASTGTGSRGRSPISQSNGATRMPHRMVATRPIVTTSFCCRQNRMMEFTGPRGGAAGDGGDAGDAGGGGAAASAMVVPLRLAGVRLVALRLTFGRRRGSGGLARRWRQFLDDRAAAEHLVAEVGVVDRLAALQPVGPLEVERHRAVGD